MFFRFVYIGLCLLSIAVSFYVKRKLNFFLERNTAIANDKSLEEYKKLVRINMYGALAQILLIFGALGSFIAHIINQGFREVFSLFLLGFAVSFINEIGKLEEQVRTLNCATTELESQYKKISHIWKKKALPNF
jgi:hypothetical protein